MNKKTNLLFVIFFLFLFTHCYSQQYSLGGSLIYNFSTKGIGLGVRAEFPLENIDLLEGVSVTPQLSYFPWFNEVSEFYIGSSAHLYFYRHRKWLFYGLANLSYKGWINHNDSDDENARFSNLALEAGAGVTRRACLRPFMELRLNFIGAEPNIRIGVVKTFNCKIRGQVPCSKVPPPPTFE